MSVITDRRALALCGLLLGACTSDNPLYIGDADGGGSDGASSTGDGGKRDSGTTCPPACNDDLAAPDLSMPEPRDLAEPPSDLARVCTATCGSCFNGGACCPGAPNGGCCGRGEWCDKGTCRCGDGPSCTGLDHCAAGGIISFGSCGSTCCGGIGDPCPL